MDKLTMHTPNLVDENIRKIAELFPNAVTERKNEQGQVEQAIDFDVLRQELSQVVVEGPQERYQFTWPDKRKAVLLANASISDALRPCREESVDFDTTQNLYIEGDNLNVLKLLRETYLDKVKMIYIDPPYNTGSDFVYEDDFREDTDAYMGRSGQFDAKGNRLVQNTESNGRFHTDWLNMMYPRLRLAKDLLAKDGVIFISIDDNEQANLKKVCDEVFGEQNSLGNYIKQSKVGGGADSRFIVKEHEYCFVYAKASADASEMFIPHEETYLTRYKEKDEDGRYFWDTLARPGLKNPIIYGIEAPDGTSITNGWIWSNERFLQAKKTGKVRIVKSGDKWSVQFKQYLNMNGKKPRSMTMDFGGSFEGKIDFGKLFDDEKTFPYPKSVKYIKTLVQTMGDNNGIILDFFSGSATTAHAVMQLNAEDGGKRKFIMVQLPEATDAKSEAYKAGYKNICEIGKERIRRAGAKIKEELEKANQQLKLGEEPKPLPDTGFRVLKLDSSNMKDVYYSPTETTQLDMDSLADNIKEDRSPEDLLFQVMLELGVLPSSSITQMDLGGKRVFSVAEGFLLACFDSNINETTITEIAKLRPHYAVFRDSGYANDSVATNFEQIFKAYSPDTVRRVL